MPMRLGWSPSTRAGLVLGTGAMQLSTVPIKHHGQIHTLGLTSTTKFEKLNEKRAERSKYKKKRELVFTYVLRHDTGLLLCVN